MKKTASKDLEQKNAQELMSLLKTDREELAQLTLDKNTGKLKNLRSIFHKKKEIARILTTIRQKELLNG